MPGRPPINLSRFDLISLRLFVATVEGGSLTAGAARFGISVAAASKRIAEFEAHVGADLLLRSKRGVVPTAAGETLLRHAIGVVAALEQMAMAMDDFRRGVGGHLRLWANPSAMAGFLPDLLGDYTVAYPLVRIDLEDAPSEEAVRAVVRGTAELAVIGDNVHAAGLQTIVCNVDEFVLLLPARHPLAGRETVGVGDALSLDIIGMGRATSLMREIAAAAETLGKALRIRVQVRSFDTMCRMVSAGVGAAILPRLVAEPHVGPLRLAIVRLTGLRTERRLLLALRDRETLSTPAEAFVRMAHTHVQAQCRHRIEPGLQRADAH